MTWESFYLVCFFVGLFLTIASFVLGAHMHLPLHVHLPFHVHLPHMHVAHDARAAGISPLNLTTLLTFLTWFGGAGYLITHYRSGAAGLAFAAALVLGFFGATLMYLFTVRMFVAYEHPLREEDFDMIGVLGHVSVPIHSGGGTGELIYSQEGTRRSCGARSEAGQPIERGTEVVVMRYDKGIAYVRPWAELQKAELLNQS